MKLKKQNALTGLAFTLPFLVGFALLYLVPFIWSIQRTLTAGAGGTRFVGLANYFDLFHSAAFRLAAGNTLRFIGVGVPLLMALSFLLALALHRKFRGASFFRSAFLLPLVIPVASVVIVVQAFFGGGGLVNQLLEILGLPIQNWIESKHAFPLLVGLYIWKNCGYDLVLFLAGLSAIPSDYADAATCDGATPAQVLRRITLPMMVPNFFFVFVISVINAFKSFREAYLLGGSHPHDSIYMLQHFMNNNFQNLNYPRLSTAALLIFSVIFLLVTGGSGLHEGGPWGERGRGPYLPEAEDPSGVHDLRRGHELRDGAVLQRRPAGDGHEGQADLGGQDHPAFTALEAARASDPEKAKKYAQVLMNQAKLIAGLPIDDPSGYTDLLCSLWS